MQVPPSVTVLAGNTSADFNITTSRVSVNESLSISATYRGKTVSSGFIIAASVVVRTISTAPNVVVGGGTSVGTVTLTDVAPAGGTVITLSSSSPDLQMPPTVTVLAGNTSATFNITTTRVSSNENVTLTTTLGSKTLSTGFTIVASVAVHYVVVAPSTVTGGTSTVGSVFLTTVAPPSGTVVSLTSSDPCAQVPLTVTVAPGDLSANFNITTTPGASNTSLSMTASLNGKSVNYGLLVATANLISLTGPTSIVGGSSATITATLNGPAPSGGAVVTLTSSSPSGTVASTFTIPAGQTSATFTMQSSAVSGTTTVTITGAYVKSAHVSIKLTKS